MMRSSFILASWNSTDSAMALFVGHHGRMQSVSIQSTKPPLSFPLGSFVLTFLLLCVSIMLYAYDRIILADQPTDPNPPTWPTI